MANKSVRMGRTPAQLYSFKADQTIYARHNSTRNHFRAVGGDEVENQFGLRMRIIGGQVARDRWLREVRK